MNDPSLLPTFSLSKFTLSENTTIEILSIDRSLLI